MFKTLRGKMYSSFSSSALFCSYVSCWIVDFQKLDHFWILWIKPNPQIVSQMLNHALFFHNLSRQIFCEIFVKIENTEYLSNQLTYANFDLAMMFPIKNWTFEQILVFLISEMYLACPTTTVKLSANVLFLKSGTRPVIWCEYNFFLQQIIWQPWQVGKNG